MEKGTVSNALRRALHQLLWVYSKWLVIAALLVFVLSGIYKIEKDAIGVLTRFGQVVEPNVFPGLHYKLPWPIDKVISLPVKQVKTLEIQDFGSRYNVKQGGAAFTFYKDTNLQPYCITGDNNIVAITLNIKYTIDDPVKYLYGMKRSEYFTERVAANLIVHHLAKIQIDEVLTYGKKQLEFDLQEAIGNELDNYQCGLLVSFLEIKEIKPPKRVQDAFDRVINAEVNKKRELNQAQGYYNRIVPEARSKADKIVQEAKTYKKKKILTAEGEASRFLSTYKRYHENPEAHRERMLLEFAKKTYPNLKEIRVVDSRRENISVVISREEIPLVIRAK